MRATVTALCLLIVASGSHVLYDVYKYNERREVRREQVKAAIIEARKFHGDVLLWECGHETFCFERDGKTIRLKVMEDR